MDAVKPMRVGVDARLLSIPLTGIGRYTLEMCKGLEAAGIDLVLYSPSRIIHGEWSKPNTLVRENYFRGRVGRMLWSQTVLPYQARQDGLDIYWGPTHRIPSGLPKEMIKVVTVHDLVWKYAPETMRPLSRFMEKTLMPIALKNADLVISDSVSTSQGLLSNYPHLKDKIAEVYLGVTEFHGCKDDFLVEMGIDEPFFLFVGTIEPRKNLARLLMAYAQLSHTEREKCTLVIVGGKGWGDVNLKSLLDSLGLREYVRLVGYVDDQQLAALYKHAQFLAMPSLYEGFGLPIIEANSFGTPVLTSRTSSLPEVAGESAVLVDPLSVESIAIGLSQFISNNQNHKSLSAKARTNASRFTWKKASGELIQNFKDCISNKKANS